MTHSAHPRTLALTLALVSGGCIGHTIASSDADAGESDVGGGSASSTSCTTFDTTTVICDLSGGAMSSAQNCVNDISPSDCEAEGEDSITYSGGCMFETIRTAVSSNSRCAENEAQDEGGTSLGDAAVLQDVGVSQQDAAVLLEDAGFSYDGGAPSDGFDGVPDADTGATGTPDAGAAELEPAA